MVASACREKTGRVKVRAGNEKGAAAAVSSPLRAAAARPTTVADTIGGSRSSRYQRLAK